MRPKNKLSPYPILFKYNDDFINSKFEADIEVRQSFNDIEITVEFQLDNLELENMILNKKAAFLLHVECASTAYRNVYTYFEKGTYTIRIAESEINEKVEICSYIVANERIQKYSNACFHPDYVGIEFEIEKGNILAIGPAQECTVMKSENELDNLPSIIKVKKLADDSLGNMVVNTDTDYIYVGLTEETYNLYCHLGKKCCKDTALSLVLFPAMIVVLERMYLYRDDEIISEYKWFVVIRKILEKNKIELDQLDIKSDGLMKITQKIFGNPVARAFDEINKIVEGR